MPPRLRQSDFGVAAEAAGAEQILERDLIEPVQIRHSLGDCILS